VPEFLWHSFLGGACLGVPAYILGTLIYSGKRIPGLVLVVVGGVCGFAFGMAIMSALAPPWAPAVVVSTVLALLGAAGFPSMPSAQAKLRGQMMRQGRGGTPQRRRD